MQMQGNVGKMAPRSKEPNHNISCRLLRGRSHYSFFLLFLYISSFFAFTSPTTATAHRHYHKNEGAIQGRSHPNLLSDVSSCNLVTREMDRRGADSSGSGSANQLTLDGVRDSLIRQEDTIIFSLIERARFPINSAAYDECYGQNLGFNRSLVAYIVKETEAIHAKAGRYQSPEEQPFFPDNLPSSLLPPNNDPQVLHVAADSININSAIWDFYVRQLLPLFTAQGDDGNYAATAASDLSCLQALSRRIHYGKFVAEVKFKDAPQDYGPAIRAQDRDALMKMLTFESVEEMVKRRVEKKAKTFGQEVTLSDDAKTKSTYKVDPAVVSRLYDEWVMPLTKQVQVEYLLRRLDSAS